MDNKAIKDIKIIFTDIDQTLFSHRTKRVPESAIKAIKEMQSKGIKVFLSSRTKKDFNSF